MRYFVALLIIGCLRVGCSLKSSDYKLELVQVIFRHGDRTVTASERYPKDPYNSTVYEPFGIGQLTNRGKARVYHLGQILKKKYVDLIGDEYEPGIVYGYSTNTDRTKMSLQLALAGLFPPTEDLQWNASVNWNPIPVHYNFDSFDFLWTPYYCLEFEKLWNDTLALPEVQRKLAKYRDFIDYLANSTGLPNEPQIAINLNENIHAQKNLGLKYPNWCNDEVYEKLGNVSAFRYDVYVYTNQMRKIAVGPTIRRLLRNMEEIDGPKIYLYAAHDDNVGTFVRTHNFDSPALRQSDYASAVVIEKLKDNVDGQTHVRILYYPGKGEDFHVLKLKDCDEICPLDKYLKIMAPVLPFGDGTQCLYEQAYQDVKNVINGSPASRINTLELKYVPL